MIPPEKYIVAADKWAEKWIPQLFLPFIGTVCIAAILGVLIWGGK